MRMTASVQILLHRSIHGAARLFIFLTPSNWDQHTGSVIEQVALESLVVTLLMRLLHTRAKSEWFSEDEISTRRLGTGCTMSQQDLCHYMDKKRGLFELKHL
ncbi:unnamed protein product [Dicrocoelium dendriticum]|nr:unnamed protein product [Dicrocoelium dendriticum]